MFSLSEKVILLICTIILCFTLQMNPITINKVYCPKPSTFGCYGDEQCGECVVHGRLYLSKCVFGLCNLCAEEVMVPT